MIFFPELGILLNKKGNGGLTPLMLAARQGMVDLANYFIDNGIDINEKFNGAYTALRYAVVNNHTKVAHILLSLKKIQFDFRDLFIKAFRNNNQKIIEDLVDEAHDQNKFQTEKLWYNWSNLTIGSVLNNIELVNASIENGENVNQLDSYDFTPLFYAAAAGNTEVVRILLDQEDINIDAKLENQKTLFLEAAALGKTDLVKILLDNGADINFQTYSDGCALLMAVERNMTDLFMMLLRQPGINVTLERQQYPLTTPMNAAIKIGNVHFVQELLDAGVEPDW